MILEYTPRVGCQLYRRREFCKSDGPLILRLYHQGHTEIDTRTAVLLEAALDVPLEVSLGCSC